MLEEPHRRWSATNLASSSSRLRPPLLWLSCKAAPQHPGIHLDCMCSDFRHWCVRMVRMREAQH